MKREGNLGVTNAEVLGSLEKMNKGKRDAASTELVFDPKTGEFVVVKPNQNLPADATTINSIARDGFAKGKKK